MKGMFLYTECGHMCAMHACEDQRTVFGGLFLSPHFEAGPC